METPEPLRAAVHRPDADLPEPAGRLIAVGDIHGHLSKLTRLLEQVDPQPEDRIVFLGDYIDRGPDSYAVVELLIDFRERFPKTVTLRGNHEDIVLSFFMDHRVPLSREWWVEKNGGRATLGSYKRRARVVAVHQPFFRSLPIVYETDDFFFCHAGIRPGVPLAEQRATDLLTIRDEFLDSTRQWEKVIVHGHSHLPEERPEIRANRINLDTGAGYYGPLTAMELPSQRIWQAT